MPKDFLDKVIERDAERKREKKNIHKEITFREYLGLVKKDPAIAQLSPSRLLETVKNKGVIELSEEDAQFSGIKTGYPLFREELYGLDKPIFQLVEHLEVGATRGSSGKYIPILVGPPGSGKSTTVRILAKALEKYDIRPIFCIKGCPKHEEPLHLLPRNLREEVAKKEENCEECLKSKEPEHLHLGVQIEGDLCPVCRHLLLNKYQDEDGTIRWQDVPVESFTFSIQGRRGISSFEPSNDIGADIAILSGREISGYTQNPDFGYDHPLAFQICGEIPAGERGFTEAREITSNDPKILRVFFSVAEEKELKIEGSSFPHLSVDTVVIGHTNPSVFKKFSLNNDYEGLHDRFNIILCPLPIRIKDEMKIYRKLIERESDFVTIKKCHIAPGSLELAALFAILTRLVPSQMGIDLLTKAKVYNGNRILTELRDKNKRPIDIREILEEGQAPSDIAKKEGMFGVSSRTVLSALNGALAKEPNLGCLTPLKTIVALREIFEKRMGFTPEEVDQYKELLSSGESGGIISEDKEFSKYAVQNAFIKAYGDLAKQMFNNYIKEVKFYRGQKGRKFVKGLAGGVIRDSLTGKPKEPNMKFLKDIEAHIPISESMADTYRGELLELSEEITYENYPDLAEAVNRKLISDSREMLISILASDKPKSDEAKKRANELFSELTENGGFCHICAKEIIEKASDYLNE